MAVAAYGTGGSYSRADRQQRSQKEKQNREGGYLQNLTLGDSHRERVFLKHYNLSLKCHPIGDHTVNAVSLQRRFQKNL